MFSASIGNVNISYCYSPALLTKLALAARFLDAELFLVPLVRRFFYDEETSSFLVYYFEPLIFISAFGCAPSICYIYY